MLKKIGVEHLKLGMHLHELCGPWMDHPFWRSKFVLQDEADLRRIVDSGITEVWIDVEKGLDVVDARVEAEVHAEVEKTLAKVAPSSAAPQRVSVAEEVRRASKICANGKQAVISMFQEARMGKAIAAESAGRLVDEIASSVMRNPGALISLARLKSADDYTYMHSLAVSALMVAMGRQMKLDDATVRELGLAGLMHDIGKVRTPLTVLNKPGKLTDAEFDIIKGHPTSGYELLLESHTASKIVLDVCLHHHEKVGGGGYPERLQTEQISMYAKMGAVCDVYDAITSNRPYKPGWDPAESIKKMTEWCKGHFDEQVFQGFVKSMGIYPTGSLVRLESGRLAIVVEQSAKS
ncbi:MAG TPA: HD-GYP domain-containing protein, partial [Rhodocyclaceae bacterium]|nr:HD-GYP domain-containing protein [Rhodocyclaceae bacterium]